MTGNPTHITLPPMANKITADMTQEKKPQLTASKRLPKLGFIYLDHVWRFFVKSNFKNWPDPIEAVTYHWRNDRNEFINEVKRKKIDVLIGNIPSTAYEMFKEIAKDLPDVRFVPSLESQFANKSKENVTLFCEKHDLPIPPTDIFYNKNEGFEFLEQCTYPRIIKRSYGASNFGGYYVHKVDTKEEAIKLFKEKRYMPMYIQECIPLTADIRVMLIGHRPVCAFWRVAGDGEWITNTSQGGYMDYSGVPKEAIDISVAASKAADAEFWACDIAVAEGEYYILECATAFAAFPYIRDWIAQYLMWDLSDGRFKKPNIPMYHWEELGKMSASVLRKMRHIEFSDEALPSADGELWREGYEQYPMQAMDGQVDLPDVPHAIIQQQLQLEAYTRLHDSQALQKRLEAENLTVSERILACNQALNSATIHSTVKQDTEKTQAKTLETQAIADEAKTDQLESNTGKQANDIALSDQSSTVINLAQITTNEPKLSSVNRPETTKVNPVTVIDCAPELVNKTASSDRSSSASSTKTEQTVSESTIDNVTTESPIPLAIATQMDEEASKSALDKPLDKPLNDDKSSVLSKKKAQDQRINIATASVIDFQSLTGIGPKRAEAIVNYRETLDGFQSVNDILQVSGISQRLFARFIAEICLD